MFASKPHSITVTLKLDGLIETIVDGIKGPSCEEATRWLEGLGTTIDHGNTPEFYEIDTQVVGVSSKF